MLNDKIENQILNLKKKLLESILVNLSNSQFKSWDQDSPVESQ
jgi:hypothetical protein